LFEGSEYPVGVFQFPTDGVGLAGKKEKKGKKREAGQE
jgi:hypothetical protein